MRARAASTAGTCGGPGSACSAWRSRTSMCACARWACCTTSASCDFSPLGIGCMAEYETVEHDVLVIGAGGAGLRAAIAAADASAIKVGVGCKQFPAMPHTVMVEGG